MPTASLEIAIVSAMGSVKAASVTGSLTAMPVAGTEYTTWLCPEPPWTTVNVGSTLKLPLNSAPCSATRMKYPDGTAARALTVMSALAPNIALCTVRALAPVPTIISTPSSSKVSTATMIGAAASPSPSSSIAVANPGPSNSADPMVTMAPLRVFMLSIVFTPSSQLN